MGVFDEGMLFYEKRKYIKKEKTKEAPSKFDGAFQFFAIEMPKKKPNKHKKRLKIPVVNVKDSV